MKLQWSSYAQSDRNSIYDYIDAESPRAAILIDDRIGSAVQTLRHFPQIGRPGRVEGTRELIIQHTPYIVAYLIQVDTVRVLRVLHSAQVWPNTLPNR